MKNKLLHTGLATMLASSLHGAIVYQDNFDDDTLATNTGIGGGLQQFTTGGSMVDNGNLTAPSTGHNGRGNYMSLNSFDLTGGFTLTVSYDLLVGASVPGDANRSTFGLVDASATEARTNHFVSGTESISFVAFHPTSSLGLAFGGASVDSSLTIDETTAGFEDVVITVAANGIDYSYSVGGTSQSGMLATAFDFSKQYRFEGDFQDAEYYDVFESVTLEVVPEPSSTALLGLGGLALILRRRK
ncbi:MAG: PEP-CTERM sorting domain-containing protein [Akkermansiaceae bacterium]